MKWAKGVSVKDLVWDDKGKTSPLDYDRMLKIVLDAGFKASREKLEAARERLAG